MKKNVVIISVMALGVLAACVGKRGEEKDPFQKLEKNYSSAAIADTVENFQGYFLETKAVVIDPNGLSQQSGDTIELVFYVDKSRTIILEYRSIFCMDIFFGESRTSCPVKPGIELRDDCLEAVTNDERRVSLGGDNKLILLSDLLLFFPSRELAESTYATLEEWLKAIEKHPRKEAAPDQI